MTRSNGFLIVGNGAGGNAAAATMAQQGIPVRIYGRNPEKTRRFQAAGAITLVEDGQRVQATDIDFIAKLDGAVSENDTIVVLVPTSALGDYARDLAPHLQPGCQILLAPGHTGGALWFRKVLQTLRPELTDIVIGESCELPFVARMTGPTEVTVWRRLENLVTGVLPASRTRSFIDVFIKAFGGLIPGVSVLESSLYNLNAVMHPAGMICNTGWIEATSGGFRFYADGVTPGVARVMDAVDAERVAIGRAFGIELSGFRDMFHAAGLVATDIWEKHDTYLAVHHSGPNRDIKAPDNMLDRYVVEDVGAGFVALQALARCANVPTPTIDAMLLLANLINEADYEQSGLTAAKMGISGLDRDELLAML
jgi:opine dehydrogenase